MGKIISKSPLSNQIFKLKPIRNDLQEVNLLDVKKIIANGTYIAEDEGYEGYLSVDVDIPIMRDIKVITTEGIHEASKDGVVAYSQVSVEIPTTSITITPTREEQTFIPEDGTYFDEVIVEPMKANLQEITIDTSGEYYYDNTNYDGIGKVVVEETAENLENFIQGKSLKNNFFYEPLGIWVYRNDYIDSISVGSFSQYKFALGNENLEGFPNILLPGCVEIDSKNFLLNGEYSNSIKYIILPYNGIIGISSDAFDDEFSGSENSLPRVRILVPSNLLTGYKEEYKDEIFVNWFQAIPEVE